MQMNMYYSLTCEGETLIMATLSLSPLSRRHPRMHTCALAHARTHTCTCTHVGARAHTHTHTHTHTESLSMEFG